MLHEEPVPAKVRALDLQDGAVRSDGIDARTVEGRTGRAHGAPGRSRGQDPNAPPRLNNGLTGDPHPSTKEIGRVVHELGVTNTVNEIRKQMASRRGATQ
jgi:hypothetical protein